MLIDCVCTEAHCLQVRQQALGTSLGGAESTSRSTAILKVAVAHVMTMRVIMLQL